MTSPFDIGWALLKGFRHKYGPVTHYHGARGVPAEEHSMEGDGMKVGRNPNQYRELIESIMREGLQPGSSHGNQVFMADNIREAHGYAGGRPLFGIRTEGLDLEEGHMMDAHHVPHTVHEGAIDPERLVLISPNTFHENLNYAATINPNDPNYVEPRNLPEGGLTDSYGRSRLQYEP